MTPKQTAFAEKYVECGNASEAYRHAYDAENMSPQALKVEASRLLVNPNITLTIVELQEAARERCMVNVEGLTRELDEDRKLAREERQASPAIAAVMAKAKLHGLLTDKVEHGGEWKVRTLADLYADFEAEDAAETQPTKPACHH